jgi:hypothetical protein
MNTNLKSALSTLGSLQKGLRLLQSLVMGLVCLAAISAKAENHATIPGMNVLASSPVAVDSVRHWVFTLNSANQVQVTFVANGAWATAALGTGQPVGGSGAPLLYVDSNYHFVYYVGTDHRLWCWLFNGAAWQNVQLNPSVYADELAGVDSTSHILWFRNGTNLFALYHNGSAWVPASPGVADYTCAYGAAVDNTSHSLYWNDIATQTLRRVVWTGRDFLPTSQSLTTNVVTYARPAVHQGTGEVYSIDTSAGRLFRFVPGFNFVGSWVGSAALDKALNGVHIGINPLNGKVILNRYNGSQDEIVVVTPNQATSDTWTTSVVPGTTGTFVVYSAMDNGNGWYFFSAGSDTLLHVIF